LISVFYSYSHRDEKLRDELAKHFSILERCGVIDQWHDRKILPGDEWDRQISEYLETAHIILLLVSVDFLASPYCFDVETARALKRHDDGEARVIPIILRPAAWQVTPLGRLQVLPKDALPVTRWPDQDDAFLNICEGMLAVAVAWRSNVAASSQPDVPGRAANGRPALQSRILDGALPMRVPVGKATVLLAMIRRSESAGLRGILEVDISYGVGTEDVRSTASFPIRFPVAPSGELAAAELILTVDSPDFEPPTQSKRITIEPTGDSDPRVFLLTARHNGELVVHLELLQDASSITDCLFKTTAVAADQVISRSHTLVSVPIDPAGSSPDVPASPRRMVLEDCASTIVFHAPAEVDSGTTAQTATIDSPAPSPRSRGLRGGLLGAAGVASAVLVFAVWSSMLTIQSPAPYPLGGPAPLPPPVENAPLPPPVASVPPPVATARPSPPRVPTDPSAVRLQIVSTSMPPGPENFVLVKGTTSGPSRNIYVLLRPPGQSSYLVHPLRSPPAADGSWEVPVYLPWDPSDWNNLGLGPRGLYELVAISTPEKLENRIVDTLPSEILASARELIRPR
jgi:TIR domain-containing protein